MFRRKKWQNAGEDVNLTYAVLVYHVLTRHADEVGQAVADLLGESGYDLPDEIDAACVATAMKCSINEAAMICIGMDESERADLYDWPLPLVRLT